MLNTLIIKEDDKDDFLIDNYIFQPFLINYEEKIETNYISLKRTKSKKIELNFNNNQEESKKNSQNKSYSPKFTIIKEIDKTNYVNKINSVSLGIASDMIDKKEEEEKIIKLVDDKEISGKQTDKLYRKDYYYKHFKALFCRYLRNKLNNLKNKCFPSFVFNNFSSPNYSFIGNVKELDNYNFLFYSIKDILIYKDNDKKSNKINKGNNQKNNNILIEYIMNNQNKNRDKNAYKELIDLLNNKLELALINFYENKNAIKTISEDEDCIFYDKHFKKETGISLLEKNGFLKAIQRYIKKINSNFIFISGFISYK